MSRIKKKLAEERIRNLIFQLITELDAGSDPALHSTGFVQGKKAYDETTIDVEPGSPESPLTHSASVESFSQNVKNKINSVDEAVKEKVKEVLLSSVRAIIFGASDDVYELKSIQDQWSGSLSSLGITHKDIEKKDIDEIYKKMIYPALQEIFLDVINSFSFSVKNTKEDMGGGPKKNVEFTLTLPKKIENPGEYYKSLINTSTVDKIFDLFLEDIKQDIKSSIDRNSDTISQNPEKGLQILAEMFGFSSDDVTSIGSVTGIATGGLTMSPKHLADVFSFDISWLDKTFELLHEGISVATFFGLILKSPLLFDPGEGFIKTGDKWLTLNKDTSKIIKKLKVAGKRFSNYIFKVLPYIALADVVRSGVNIWEEDFFYKKTIDVYFSVVEKSFNILLSNVKNSKEKIVKAFLEEEYELEALDKIFETLGNLGDLFSDIESEINKVISRPYRETSGAISFSQAFAGQNPITQYHSVIQNSLSPYSKKYTNAEKIKLSQKYKEDMTKMSDIEIERYIGLRGLTSDLDHDSWYRKKENAIEDDVFTPAEAYFLKDVFKIGNKEYNEKIVKAKSEREIEKIHDEQKEKTRTKYNPGTADLSVQPEFFQLYLLCKLVDFLTVLSSHVRIGPMIVESVNKKMIEINSNVFSSENEEIFEPFKLIFKEVHVPSGTGEKVITGQLKDSIYDEIIESWKWSSEILQYYTDLKWEVDSDSPTQGNLLVPIGGQQIEKRGNSFPISVKSINIENKEAK